MEQIACSFPRDWRKWSLRSRSQLKSPWRYVRTESQYPGNKKRHSVCECSTFLKINKSKEQFPLPLTLFLPYLRLTVKIFQFLRLSTKLLVVLRLSVNPIETLLYKILGDKQGASGVSVKIVNSNHCHYLPLSRLS